MIEPVTTSVNGIEAGAYRALRATKILGAIFLGVIPLVLIVAQVRSSLPIENLIPFLLIIWGIFGYFFWLSMRQIRRTLNDIKRYRLEHPRIESYADAGREVD